MGKPSQQRRSRLRMTIYNIAKSNEERKTNNSKMEVLQKENQDMKESIATFSQEKNSSLSAQTECYSKKHEVG